MPFAVTVTFQIEPGRMDEFMPLMLANAAASLSRRAGLPSVRRGTDRRAPGRGVPL